MTEASAAMEAFTTYARSRRMVISDVIEPHRFPGRGLGIRAVRKIEKGTVLVHVPLSALIMPWSNTSSERSGMKCDDGVTVRSHAKLAARVAFGDMRGHDAWQATWPTLRDFQQSLPLLWPERTRDLYCRPCATETAVDGLKEANGTSLYRHREKPFAILPPAVTGLWATVSSNSPAIGSEMKSTHHETDGKPLLPSQSAKFHLDLSAARHLYPSLDFEEANTLDRFTWAWSIVNTRCFYYVAPGIEPPTDSDEAMVLCPGIDLFNHASHGCDVTYDSEGFWVRANRVYVAGEEVVTSYGAHGEDTLMVEYGFLMGGDNNEWDGVGIDGVVLATLKAEQKKLLEDYGFLGGYTMRRGGVCWRTEVAARCVVMEVVKWDRFVAGRWTDQEDEVNWKGTTTKKKRRRRKGAISGEGKETPKLMSTQQAMAWVEQVRKEAENSLDGLQAMTNDETWLLFGANDSMLTGMVGLGPDQKSMTAARHDMVVRRWEQILDTSCKALESLRM